MFDWTRISPRLPVGRVRALMDALYGAGPFGFRGPAADRLPDHLTQIDQGMRTTQVIAPGLTCPSNAFFERALAETGTDHLYITSANRSRHLTGAAEEPAHWKAGALAADFAHLDDLVVLAHRDEAGGPRRVPAATSPPRSPCCRSTRRRVTSKNRRCSPWTGTDRCTWTTSAAPPRRSASRCAWPARPGNGCRSGGTPGRLV